MSFTCVHCGHQKVPALVKIATEEHLVAKLTRLMEISKSARDGIDFGSKEYYRMSEVVNFFASELMKLPVYIELYNIELRIEEN